MIINWKIHYVSETPKNLQPSDYWIKGQPFWFLKYFDKPVDVDVVDISAPKTIEKLEKKLHFHFLQVLRVLRRLNQYDVILAHGTDSAVLLGALKRIFHLKTPPIVVVDISSFHQADTSGLVHKLCVFASKSFDWLIYLVSTQITYFREYFPWIADKSTFVRQGVDGEYWGQKKYSEIPERDKYLICVGYRRRDWKTLIRAYEESGISQKLLLVGNSKIQTNNPNIKALPFVPIDRLNQLIVNASFSVIPLDDFNYAFGQTTMMQQMALGVPLIAADVPALRDYISQTDGIMTYQAYDVDDLSHCLVELASMGSAEKEKMSLANIESIKDALSEKRMARRYEEIIERVISASSVK